MERSHNRGSSPIIGLDLHVVDGIFQGSRTHCLELFSRVVKRSPEFQFVVLADKPQAVLDFSAAFAAENVKLVRMRHSSPTKRLLWQLPQLARAGHFDLLHTQYIIPPFAPCATAVTVHDILFESHPQFFGPAFVLRSRLLIRHSCLKSAMVFTVSKFSRNQIAETYGVAPLEVHTIYNGVDTSRFFPGGGDGEGVQALGLVPGGYILTVGRLEPRKNHVALLRAYAKLNRPRPKLVIVGQRHFGFDDVLRVMSELRLQDDVVHLDALPDALLPAVYRNALFFVYPTWAEGFGMPVLEAMASGTPVIVSQNTALPEIAGDAGVYIHPEDPGGLRDAMQKLLLDRELRLQLRERGLQRANVFNWDQSAECIRQSYLRHFGMDGTDFTPRVPTR